jgi:hypothetical protein
MCKQFVQVTLTQNMLAPPPPNHAESTESNSLTQLFWACMQNAFSATPADMVMTTGAHSTCTAQRTANLSINIPGIMGRGGGKPPIIIGGICGGAKGKPGGRICGGASCGGP